MFVKNSINPWLYYLLAIVVVGVIFYAFGYLFHSSGAPEKYKIGRKATQKEVAKLNIDVRPDGRGLPVGLGKVEPGRLIYQQKCLSCHGNGSRDATLLPGGLLFISVPSEKIKTIGSYWPYATTIFDYVRRAMPYNAPGSLSNQEVYDLTAYLLFENKIITESFVLTEKTLPAIVMPARKLFVDDDRQGGHEIR